MPNPNPTPTPTPNPAILQSIARSAQASITSLAEPTSEAASTVVRAQTYRPPWSVQSSSPAWLVDGLRKKGLGNVSVYITEMESSAAMRKLFSQQLYRAIKQRPEKPGCPDVSLVVPEPNSRTDWASIHFTLQSKYLQAFAANLFSRIIEPMDGIFTAVSPDGREYTPSAYDTLWGCSRQNISDCLGSWLYAGIRGTSAWWKEEASGEPYTKCVTLQWHRDTGMDCYLWVGIADHLIVSLSRATNFSANAWMRIPHVPSGSCVGTQDFHTQSAYIDPTLCQVSELAPGLKGAETY